MTEILEEGTNPDPTSVIKVPPEGVLFPIPLSPSILVKFNEFRSFE
jgi:hypothetical protein